MIQIHFDASKHHQNVKAQTAEFPQFITKKIKKKFRVQRALIIRRKEKVLQIVISQFNTS